MAAFAGQVLLLPEALRQEALLVQVVRLAQVLAAALVLPPSAQPEEAWVLLLGRQAASAQPSAVEEAPSVAQEGLPSVLRAALRAVLSEGALLLERLAARVALLVAQLSAARQGQLLVGRLVVQPWAERLLAEPPLVVQPSVVQPWALLSVQLAPG